MPAIEPNLEPDGTAMPIPQGTHAWHAIAPQPGSKGSKVFLPVLRTVAFAPYGTEEPAEVRGQTQTGEKWGAWFNLAQTSAAQADGLSQGAKLSLLPP